MPTLIYVFRNWAQYISMRWRPHVFTLLVLSFVGATALASGSYGHPGAALHSSVTDDTSEVLELAAELVEQGQYGPAIRRLDSLADRDPLLSGEHGSVAYLLGRAHQQRGDPETALSVWREGASQLERNPERLDYFLSDAYIQEAFRQGNAQDRQRASRLYRSMIQKAGNGPVGAQEEILNRYLRELALVLPERVQSRTGLTFDRRTMSLSLNPSSNAGGIVDQWWERQDPLPSTEENERLREHLRRSVHARRKFSHEKMLDDRGKVYIRLGDPRDRTSVGMKDNSRTSRIETEIRRNEFWVYGQINQSAHFLFVEMDPNYYEVAGLKDLFPTRMSTGLGGRPEDAREYLYELEDVLQELATFSGDYSNLATEVFDRAALARDQAQYGAATNSFDTPVNSFIEETETRIETLDQRNERRRVEKVPQTRSSVSKSVPDLPIASRTARYLTETGKTRVELYWSVHTGQLAKSDESDPPPSTLLANVVQKDAQQERKSKISRRYRVSASARSGAILTPQVLALATPDSLFYLDVQWDQYQGGSGQGAPGSLLGRHTQRYGTFTALRNDPNVLEMSDVKLLTVPAQKSETAFNPDDAIPYPFYQVSPAQPLAISFELYHLGLDENERSEYTITYRAERTSESGGIADLFGGEDGEKTATRTTYQGNSRSSEEYILLDTENLAGDEPRNVDVVVTAIDEVTGQEVTRTISFRMMPLQK